MSQSIALKDEIIKLVGRASELAFDAEAVDGLCIELTQATKSHFGHYQCNNAMALARTLKNNPRSIAQAWCEKIIACSEAMTPPMFEKVEVAGPGFINLTLSKSFLSQKLQEASWTQQCKDPDAGKAVIDYSSPNIAKQMHVGHLRSTIIGESLKRLLEYCGWEVSGVNHVGDWGTQFGMLITYIFDQELQNASWLCEAEGDTSDSLAQLMQLYRQARSRFTEDEDFAQRSKKAVVKLQSGCAEYKQIWEKICEISRKDFSKIYQLLDVEIDEKGESFYQDLLKPVVDDLEARGVARLSDGALCVFIPEFKIPYMLRKSDGGFNYDTTDLAALRYRVEEEKAKRLIYVTDAGQKLHFDLLFATAKAAGYVQDQQLDHVGFGLVLGKDGKKFKTREGETEKLMDLITEAIDRSKQLLIARDRESVVDLEESARRIGVGALKYADLSNDRVSDYQFSYEKMLSFEGNTAIFLFYSLVRAKSILRKLDSSAAGIQEIHLQEPSEVQLALCLLQWPEAIELTRQLLAPHRLAEYLYQLASRFNHFFRDCRVQGDASEQSRASLVAMTADVLSKGLEILGLETVEQM